MRSLFVYLTLFLLAETAHAQRVTVSLDGTWQIADSVKAEAMPETFDHKVPVPGMANLAQPPFPDVDRFDSRAVISNRIRKKMLPESAMVETAGVSRQQRNYFWYRRTFQAPQKKQRAILKINKAQFGTAVWLNGKKIGDHLGCFTAGYFDITKAIDWAGQNTVTVRIGAHPGVLPPEIPAGDDFEKNYWTPGIYDSVSVLLCDNPVIETIQVAPRIERSEIVVQTEVRNFGKAGQFGLKHTVKTWKGESEVTATPAQTVALAAGEQKTVTQTIAIPDARLWSPEDPFLYVLETTTGGDSLKTRFGMREFRFDTATRRAYLNGKVYFLRGSHITLHRFFEDPKCGNLPWREDWVRKLLVDIPKRMHWNTFRFCIGPVPDRWLEIADEAGLLIQNEFFIWTGHPQWKAGFNRTFDGDVLIAQYKEWMRDNWNHPSVVIWDANNESYDAVFADKVIPAVRGLDLSNRPWENSYNLPAGPDDPVEDHPYLYIRNNNDNPKPTFRITELERMNSRGRSTITPTGRATLCNEYGWLWVNRDGSPTVLTKRIYEKLLKPDATAEQRFELNGYLLGGLTEFWRAHRNYAGIIHFVYLTSSDPDAYTSDHFRDVETLTLDPHFTDYVGEAFKPVGVYINFWQSTLKADAEREFIVMVVNDLPNPARGALSLILKAESGEELIGQQQPLELAPLGQRTYNFRLHVPQTTGTCLLIATASQSDGETTVSRRKLKLVP